MRTLEQTKRHCEKILNRKLTTDEKFIVAVAYGEGLLGIGDYREVMLKDILGLCDKAAHDTDGGIPDATGGRFAKKYAANSIRSLAATIEKTFVPKKGVKDAKGKTG